MRKKSSQTDDENSFERKMASEGHPRSTILGSLNNRPVRNFMTPHNNIGFNSKGPEDMSAKITRNRRLLPQWATFLPVIVCVYELPKPLHLCTRVQGHSRSLIFVAKEMA